MNQVIVILWVKAGERTQGHNLRTPLIERSGGLQSSSLKTQTQSHTVTSKNLKETQLPVAGETVTIMITSISTVFLLPHW